MAIKEISLFKKVCLKLFRELDIELKILDFSKADVILGDSGLV